jgi:hypothetical protein
MKEMAKHVPDAGSYAPITILVDERPEGGVRLSYDRMTSLLAPYAYRMPWRSRAIWIRKSRTFFETLRFDDNDDTRRSAWASLKGKPHSSPWL